MYKFAPKLKKTKEKIIMSVYLLLAGLSYGASGLLPFPALYQLVAVLSLTVSVLVIVRYLLRDYVYCIRENEDGEASELAVVEIMGKKQTVVCRILLQNVGRIFSREVFASEDVPRKSIAYRYVSERTSTQSFFVEILDEEKNYFIEICADERLLELIRSGRAQKISDI